MLKFLNLIVKGYIFIHFDFFEDVECSKKYHRKGSNKKYCSKSVEIAHNKGKTLYRSYFRAAIHKRLQIMKK